MAKVIGYVGKCGFYVCGGIKRCSVQKNAVGVQINETILFILFEF